jgi:hypothetical protein
MYHGVTQSIEDNGRERRPSRPEAEETPGEENERKERVIHTRVPAVLERELKRFADNLRIPVSNLVRTILEDALDVADAATESASNRLRRAAGKLEEERDRLKKKVQLDPLAHVFAYQPVTLAQPAQCAKCQEELRPGNSAHMGLSDEPTRPGKGPRRIFVCDSCLPKK